MILWIRTQWYRWRHRNGFAKNDVIVVDGIKYKISHIARSTVKVKR